MQTNREQLDRETLRGRTRRWLLKGERIKGLKADRDDPATFTMTVPGAPAQMASGAIQFTLATIIASLQGAASSAPHRLPWWIAAGARKAFGLRPTDPCHLLLNPCPQDGDYGRPQMFRCIMSHHQKEKSIW